MSSTVRDQLHVLHNPFAETTSQPKIPDGKSNDSLGFSTRHVSEYRNKDGTTTMEILLFAGMNAGAIIFGSDTGSNRFYFIPGFEGSNSANWDNFVDANTDFTVKNEDRYGLWRLVSQGLQLKLLNPQEEDDGWWEAIRINEPLNTDAHALTTTNDSGDRATNGCVAPVFLPNTFSMANLVNDSTYSTGLLRDLHRVQFELHGRKDYHDFTVGKDDMLMDSESALSLVPFEQVLFNSGHDDAFELIQQFIDESYDMILIRLHCRENGVGSEGLQGSRFHFNLISNQEIYFPQAARENRFHTKSETIGASAMSIHFQGRRANQSAATLVGL